MKRILLVFITVLFLYSCSNPESVENTQVTEKVDFFIDVKPFESFWSGTEIKKVWKIEWSQDLKISSQALWKISRIHVKEWQKVEAGQVLVSLSDSIASYWINLDKALNNLDRAKITYDSTKLTLDKQVFDSEIALEKLNSSYAALKKNVELDIDQAKDNLENSEYENLDSKSALQLAQLDNAIEKSELDFNNKLISDKEAIEWFKSTYKKEYNSILVFLGDIIEFWDKLFWVTDKYDDETDKYDDYLWGKNLLIRDEAERDLRDLLTYKNNKLNSINPDSITEENLLVNIALLNDGYELSKKYLNNFEETLNQTITSLWIISEAEVSAYITAINAYQAQLQGNYTAFIAYDNGASTFLRTYKNMQDSLLKQIELQKKDREIVKKTLESTQTQFQTGYDKILTSGEDSITWLELQIKSTKNNLENAIRGREITLKSLENGIREAEIAYESAQKEYAKLTITAPISWVIWDIMVDVWADVANMTPLLTLVWTSAMEVEVWFTQIELGYVSVWSEAYIEINGKKEKGVIYSLSSVADQNLNYKANIVFDSVTQNLWWIVDVIFPIQSKYTLLPINVVQIWSSDEWQIQILKDWKIETVTLNLWKTYEDAIEIVSVSWTWSFDLLEDASIIVSDITNFDNEKFTLKIRN